MLRPLMQIANALSLFFAAGALTPVCVLAFNAVWGVAASWWLRGTKG